MLKIKDRIKKFVLRFTRALRLGTVTVPGFATYICVRDNHVNLSRDFVQKGVGGYVVATPLPHNEVILLVEAGDLIETNGSFVKHTPRGLGRFLKGTWYYTGTMLELRENYLLNGVEDDPDLLYYKKVPRRVMSRAASKELEEEHLAALDSLSISFQRSYDTVVVDPAYVPFYSEEELTRVEKSFVKAPREYADENDTLEGVTMLYPGEGTDVDAHALKKRGVVTPVVIPDAEEAVSAYGLEEVTSGDHTVTKLRYHQDRDPLI